MKTLLQKSKWLLCAFSGLATASSLSAQLGQGHHEIYHQSISNTQGYYAESSNKLAHADLNGDGIQDLVITGNFGLQNYLFNAAGGFRIQQVNTYPFQQPGYGASVAADLNDDGQLDFAWYDQSINDLVVTYWNSTSPSGDPIYDLPQSLNLSGFQNADGQGPYHGLYGLNAADIDSDGDTDLLAFGPNGTQRPHMILNNGGGNFVRYDLHDLPFYQSFSRVADMNNDGRPDILVSTGGTIDLYTNDGNAGNPSMPVFTHSVLFDATAIPGFDSNSGWFDLEDFDKDGKLDVLVSYSEYRHPVQSYFGRTILFINRTTSAPAYNFIANSLLESQQANNNERLGGFGARYIDVDNNGILDIVGNRGGHYGNEFDKVTLFKLSIDGAGNAIGSESTLLDYNPFDVFNFQGMNLVYEDIDGDSKRDYIYATLFSGLVSRRTAFPLIRSADLRVDLSNSLFIGGDRNEDVELTITSSDASAVLEFYAYSAAQIQGVGTNSLTITGKLGDVNMNLGYGSVTFSQMGNYNLTYTVRNTGTQETYSNTQQLIVAPPTYYPKPGSELFLQDLNSWSDSPDGLGAIPGGFQPGYQFVFSNSAGATEFGATDFQYVESNFIIPRNVVFTLDGYLHLIGSIDMKGEIKGNGTIILSGQQHNRFDGNVSLNQFEMASTGNLNLKGKLQVRDYLAINGGILKIDSGSVELSGALQGWGGGHLDASAGEFRLQGSYQNFQSYLFLGRVQKFTLNHNDINFINGSFEVDTLNLEHGKLILNNGELTAGIIIGGSTDAYIVGQAASVKMHIENGNSAKFPIGGDYYNPLTITNNTGTADDFTAISMIDWGQQEYATLDPSSRVYHVWEITKANPNGGAGVDMKLGWDVAQEWQMGLAGLYHFENNSWVELTDGAISRSPQEITYTGYTGTFSPFSIMSSFATLPVTWKNLDARAVNKAVILDWSTGSETNARDFEIQRSNDGLSWKKIGAVSALNDINGAAYSFTDNEPLTGTNYYRLNQRNKDSKNSLSKTLTVNFNGSSEQGQRFKAYPNPVTHGSLKIEIASQSLVSVHNSAGVQVVQKRLGAGTHQINLASLPKGVYTISVDGQVQRIVLQ